MVSLSEQFEDARRLFDIRCGSWNRKRSVFASKGKRASGRWVVEVCLDHMSPPASSSVSWGILCGPQRASWAVRPAALAVFFALSACGAEAGLDGGSEPDSYAYDSEVDSGAAADSGLEIDGGLSPGPTEVRFSEASPCVMVSEVSATRTEYRFSIAGSNSGGGGLFRVSIVASRLFPSVPNTPPPSETVSMGPYQVGEWSMTEAMDMFAGSETYQRFVFIVESSRTSGQAYVETDRREIVPPRNVRTCFSG